MVRGLKTAHKETARQTALASARLKDRRGGVLRARSVFIFVMNPDKVGEPRLYNRGNPKTCGVIFLYDCFNSPAVISMAVFL